VFGMAPFLVSDRLMRGRLLAALELINRWPSGHKPNPRQVRWALVNVGLKGAAPYRLYRMAQLLRARGSHGAAWLRPEVRNKYVAEDKWAWKAGVSGPRWWRFLVDALVEAPHRELRIDYLRHRAATAGVLNESPLYDFDLTDFCLRLPPELAFDRAHTRPLAREAMRGHIPDDVRLNDQKANFSGFCYEMLTGADAPGIGRLLTAPDAEIGAYVDLDWIRRMWLHDRPRPGEKTMMWGTEIWRLAAAETWLRAQADSGFADEMLARPDVLPPAVRRVDLADTGTFSPLAGVQGRI
jgi:hypothetical protein